MKEMPEGLKDLSKYAESMIFTQRIYGKTRAEDTDKELDLKFVVRLLKEMAEALEECIKYESESVRPHSETFTPARKALKKFREWK